MKTEKLTVTLLLLTALALTGCRDSSSVQTAESTENTVSQTETTGTADETTSGSEPETTVSSSDSTEKTTAAAESTGLSGSTASGTTARQTASENLLKAKKVMEQFLSAAAKGNRSQMLKCTNLEWYAELMTAMNSDLTMSKQEIVDYLFSAFSPSGRTAGKIVRYGENQKLLRELRNTVSNLKRDAGRLEGEEKKLAETILSRYRVPDHLFVFQVDTGQSGSSGIEYYTVSMTGSELLVDLTAGDTLGKYVQTSRVSSANSAAKAVLSSMNEMLTALAAQTDEVKRIDGTHEFEGSEFRRAKEPNEIRGRSDLFEALCYAAYQEARQNLGNARRVMITVKNGKVTASAVQLNSIEDPVTGEDIAVFGSAPREVGAGELIGMLTLESVLEKAAK